MRKLFTIFAAMLVALTVNAKVWNVGPKYSETEGEQETCNIFRTLKPDYTFAAGDTILLADGEYVETLSIPISKSAVILAADGARPIVKMSGYFQIHASLIVKGIKFKFVGDADSGYCMYLYDNSSKFVKMENCEFQDFKQYCVSSWEKYHIDSCIVEGCYFHDLAKAPFYFAKSTFVNDTNACDNLTVKNSTFANITLNDVAVLDLRNNNNNTKATSKLRVDHCTFYHCKGYERMIQSYKSPDVVITNCIMMNPLDADTVSPIYATYVYGATAVVDHNLNYQTKNQYISGGTVTNKIVANPLFVDAENGNFMLAAGSPAIGAASDGSNLGDPHWNARTLYLKPGVWTEASAKFAIWCFGSGSHDAQWSPFMTKVGESDVYTATIPAGYTKVIFARLNSDATAPDWEKKWHQTKNQTIDESLNLCKITGWNYSNEDKDSPCEWFKNGIALSGEMNSWSHGSDILELDGEVYKITKTLSAGGYFFKIIDHGDYRAADYWFTRENTSKSDISGDNSSNMKLVADITGDYTIVWNRSTGTLSVTFPAKDPTALDNNAVEGKATKTIVNGMLLITRDGKTYNVLGTMVK